MVNSHQVFLGLETDRSVSTANYSTFISHVKHFSEGCGSSLLLAHVDLSLKPLHTSPQLRVVPCISMLETAEISKWGKHCIVPLEILYFDVLLPCRGN